MEMFVCAFDSIDKSPFVTDMLAVRRSVFACMRGHMIHSSNSSSAAAAAASERRLFWRIGPHENLFNFRITLSPKSLRVLFSLCLRN